MKWNPAYTPGPWRARRFDECQTAIFPFQVRGGLIAIVSVGEGAPDGSEANEALIELAPEMAQVLHDLFTECAMIHKHWGDGSNIKAADDAKARGLALLARIPQKPEI